MSDHIWYLYIVRCKKGALYTGITTDVLQRVNTHNSGKGAKSVVMLGLPVELVYVEEVGTYSEALRREKAVKRLKKPQKEMLVEAYLGSLSP